MSVNERSLMSNDTIYNWNADNSAVTSFPAPTPDFRGKWNAASVQPSMNDQNDCYDHFIE